MRYIYSEVHTWWGIRVDYIYGKVFGGVYSRVLGRVYDAFHLVGYT